MIVLVKELLICLDDGIAVLRGVSLRRAMKMRMARRSNDVENGQTLAVVCRSWISHVAPAVKRRRAMQIVRTVSALSLRLLPV